jgi:hypothetical protein
MQQGRINLPVGPQATSRQRRIIRAVTEYCQTELGDLVQAGVPPQFVLFVAIGIAEGTWILMPEDTKNAFRDRAGVLRKLARDYIKLSNTLSDFVPRPTDKIEDAKTASELAITQSLEIGRMLRIHRKDRDPGIHLLLRAICVLRERQKRLGRNTFSSWEALARILATACEVAGKESREITGDALRKAYSRIVP